MQHIQPPPQEEQRKQSCKEHLSATHHLIYARCDTEQANVHQNGRYQIENCRNCQKQELLCFTMLPFLQDILQAKQHFRALRPKG